MLAKPLPERREYLADVEAKRGAAAAAYLRDAVAAEWQRQREAA